MSVAGGVPFAKAIWLLAEPPLAEAARKEGSSSIVCSSVLVSVSNKQQLLTHCSYARANSLLN
jgi:hypothetical protein